MRSFKPNVFEYLVKVNGRVHGTCRVTACELNRVATLREAIAKKVCARDEDTIVATCIGEHYWPKVRGRIG